jgi:hypothetical protein
VKAATDNQITQLRQHAVNSVTREIMTNGIRLTWAQADDLGDEVINWMSSRLGLKTITSDHGITFRPDPGVTGAHATRRYRAAQKSSRSRSRTSPADIRAVASLVEQDMSGDVDDSYARTGDAEDTIQRWYASARAAGDTDLVETIDRMGVAAAAEAYEAARRRKPMRQLGSAHATMKGNLVTLETMPEYLKASHRAARNWGVYPYNGALRERVTRDEADEIVESDPDGYARIVQ